MLQLREFGGRYPAREVIDVNDIYDVEPVVADAQPVARGELDDFDCPAVWGAVAVGHDFILPQVSGQTRATSGGRGRPGWLRGELCEYPADGEGPVDRRA